MNTPSTLRTISASCFILICLTFVIGGFIYLFVPHPPIYHRVFLSNISGSVQDSLGFRPLYWAFLRGTGGLALTVGILLAGFAIRAFRCNDGWAIHWLAFGSCLGGAPPLGASLYLRLTTQILTPWWGPVILYLVLLLGYGTFLAHKFTVHPASTKIKPIDT